MDKKLIAKYLNNNEYRIKARILYNSLHKSYEYLKQHKPSLGNFGEFILRDFLKKVLPNNVNIAQGFVQRENGELSSQCDIIIYIKSEEAIVQTFGEIYIILNSFVLSVIEVKTRVQRKTFASTLKAFKKLAKFGCCNNYIFIYNAISPQTLCSYFYPLNNNSEDFIIGDHALYDHGDQHYLPIAICDLQSNYCLFQDYVIDKHDEFGYNAYQLKENIEEISCLQMFIGAILDNICNHTNDTYEDDSANIIFNELNILYSCGLWQL